MSTAPGAAWKRPELAAPFVEERRTLLPMIAVQEDLLRRLLTRDGRVVRRFLDVGAGAGAVSEVVLRAHPDATGVLVDFSEPMIEAAHERLAGSRERWTYERADLSSPEWRDVLPAGERYDAILSGFCIHHFPDQRKREIYEECFELLAPGGLFLNWEHVDADPLTRGMFEDYMVERLVEAEESRPNPRTAEVVEREFRARAVADGDILADAETQRRWLEEIGFAETGVMFKYCELALFGGVRPSRGA